MSVGWSVRKIIQFPISFYSPLLNILDKLRLWNGSHYLLLLFENAALYCFSQTFKLNMIGMGLGGVDEMALF